MPFKFTGFADEAEKSLDGQIATLKEAGWSAIELRLVNGKSICDHPEEAWQAVRGQLEANGIEIVGCGCCGSPYLWATDEAGEYYINGYNCEDDKTWSGLEYVRPQETTA